MTKRALDIVGSLGLLVILAPLMLVVAAAVRICLGSPVLWRQTRPGRHSEPFELVKFRSMTDAVDDSGSLLPDADRLTRFGRFLRWSSLDELPELWNVLKGDMSLVGPRPLLMEYLPRYSDEQRRRHEVRPGITGWAQINGRNAVDWTERFAMDAWYVDNRSMWLDLRILARTIVAVVTRRGLDPEGDVELFAGEGDG